jgi:hypothetical protein
VRSFLDAYTCPSHGGILFQQVSLGLSSVMQLFASEFDCYSWYIALIDRSVLSFIASRWEFV